MTNAVLANDVELNEAFPNVDAGATPLGSRVLVQYRRSKGKTKGGIILTDEAKEAEKWNTQVVKVIAVGPMAFKNRNTGADWPEGTWAHPGDFVRVAKYGGDRWEVPNDVKGEDAHLFAMFNDLDLIAKVTGDPLAMKAFI